MLEKQNELQGQCVVWADRALQQLIRLRSGPKSATRKSQSVLAPARNALVLADLGARMHRPHELDYVRAHWLLGAAHRVVGQFDESEQHLHDALERCRRVGLVEHEADMLIDLARLRAATMRRTRRSGWLRRRS